MTRQRHSSDGVRRSVFALTVALLVFAQGALAERNYGVPREANGYQEIRSQQFLVQPSRMSIEQATAIVRRATGGRVLSAAPGTRGADRGYNVRVLLDDGAKVKTYFVDQNGNLR